ncbi:MAG: hypothetical protein ACLQO7_11215 [Candidatus Bathyarchaeia archaeon]
MNRGIKLSKINAKLNHSMDVTQFSEPLQQSGFVKIVFDPLQDEEPLVNLPEKGKQEVIELLLSGEIRILKSIDPKPKHMACENIIKIKLST